MRRDTFRRNWAPPPVRTDWDCIVHRSMQTFTFQRSSKALSVHDEGFDTSVSSAVLRGVRPKPKHHARMARAAAAPMIKRRHSSPRVDRQRSRPTAVGDERQLYRRMRSANFLALSARANRAARYLGSCSNVRVDSPTACGSHFERMSPISCDISV
jgi:hypothetical protein